MRRIISLITLTLASATSFTAQAALDQTCLTEKYAEFVKASDSWYASLLGKVTEQHPDWPRPANSFWPNVPITLSATLLQCVGT